MSLAGESGAKKRKLSSITLGREEIEDEIGFEDEQGEGCELGDGTRSAFEAGIRLGIRLLHFPRLEGLDWSNGSLHEAFEDDDWVCGGVHGAFLSIFLCEKGDGEI